MKSKQKRVETMWQCQKHAALFALLSNHIDGQIDNGMRHGIATMDGTTTSRSWRDTKNAMMNTPK